MTKEPIFQGQHIVPQVYLKQFGYEKNGEWWVSVYKAGTKKTQNERIIDFTKKTNIFDAPFTNIEAKRSFENLNGEIENGYRTILNNIKNQKQITARNKEYAIHFVANMLCRTNPFRNFIIDIINDENSRSKFVNEILLFVDDDNETKELINAYKSSFHINVASIFIMNHLVEIFRSFEVVIIKRQLDKGWLTTDSPVHLDKQGQFDWIIPIESEIYLPLSKDYCLFMFHRSSKINSNPLRKLRINKINEIEFELFDSITKKLVMGYHEYLIFYTETPSIEF